MSVKLDLPVSPQVLRPEPRLPVAPGIAKGEPVPSAQPGVSADGFEPTAPGAHPPVIGGSQFEGLGSLGPLSPRLEPYRGVAEKLEQLFTQDAKLRDLVDTDPRKAKSYIEGALLSADVPASASKRLAKKLLHHIKRSGGGTTPTVQTFAPKAETRAEIDLAVLGAKVGSVDDANKVREDIVKNVKPREGDTLEDINAYAALQLGKVLVDKGISLGKAGPGQDGFGSPGNGGFVPGERLEDLPAKLEPHREALEKLTDQLLRDPKLENGAQLRKSLWGELKKLPFPDEASRHEAREHLLEEIDLRTDRYTE